MNFSSLTDIICITFVSVHGLVEVYHPSVLVPLLLVLPILCVVLVLVARELLLLGLLTPPGVAGDGGHRRLRLDRDNLLDTRSEYLAQHFYDKRHFALRLDDKIRVNGSSAV